MPMPCTYISFTGGGGGGTPLYKPYRYVPPLRVWFLRRFRPTNGCFAHFGLESGMFFQETTGVHERLLFQLQMNTEKEQYMNSKWIIRNLLFGTSI